MTQQDPSSAAPKVNQLSATLPLFGPAADPPAIATATLPRVDRLVLEYFQRECAGSFCQVSKSAAAAAIGIGEVEFTQARQRLLLAGLILVDASRVGYSTRVAMARWRSAPEFEGRPVALEVRARRLQELVEILAYDANQLAAICGIAGRPGTGAAMEHACDLLREAAAAMGKVNGGMDAT